MTGRAGEAAGRVATIVQAGEVRSMRVETLRAIAVLGVLVAHLFAYSEGHHLVNAQDGPVERVLHGGGFGVYLFFAISGYLLFWPFVRAHWGDGSPIDLRRYAVNRLLRIMPLYYATLIFVQLALRDGGRMDDWLAFITWTPTFDETSLTRINAATWSVVMELHFYLVLPLFALLIARLSRGSAKAAAMLVGAAGVLSFLFAYPLAYDTSPAPFALRVSLPAVFFYFTTGMLVALGKLALERRGGPPAGLVGSAGAWLAASGVVWLWVLLANGQVALAATVPVSAIASGLLVGACVLPLRGQRLLRVLEVRWLAAIGVVSYSVYLLHGPLSELLTREVPDLTSHFLPLLAIGAVLVIAVSAASYRLVEAPFLRLRKHWSAGAAPKVGTGPADRATVG